MDPISVLVSIGTNVLGNFLRPASSGPSAVQLEQLRQAQAAAAAAARQRQMLIGFGLAGVGLLVATVLISRS
jgi:hypothetical protein